jgi:hypothetical protein
MERRTETTSLHLSDHRRKVDGPHGPDDTSPIITAEKHPKWGIEND